MSRRLRWLLPAVFVVFVQLLDAGHDHELVGSDSSVACEWCAHTDRNDVAIDALAIVRVALPRFAFSRNFINDAFAPTKTPLGPPARAPPAPANRR